MATRLFLRDALNPLSGTYPSAPQSSVITPVTITVPNLGVVRTMGSITGTAMITRTFTSSATLATQRVFHGYFCSDTLDVDQNIVPQRVALNVANYESSLNMNYGSGLTLNAYVWRPSGSGSLVGTIVDGLALSGSGEPTNSALIRTNRGSCTSTVTVSAAAGDVIICEVYQTFVSALATAYIGRFYYAGTIVTTTQNAAATSHASFFELKTSTLTFGTPATLSISGAFSNSLGTVAHSTAGQIAVTGNKSTTLATVSNSTTGRVAAVGAFSATAASAAIGGAGTVADPSITGTRNTVLTAAAVVGVGVLLTTGARSSTLATTTQSASARAALSGGFSNSLGSGGLSAAGTVAAQPTIVGTFAKTLGTTALSAAGTVGAAPPVPAPALPRDNSGGSGASSSFQRRKFVIPDLENEPVKTLEDMLGIKREPDTSENTHDLPPVPVTALPIGQAVAASPPILQYTPTLPLSSPVVVEEEEYSDEDLIHLLLMVT